MFSNFENQVSIDKITKFKIMNLKEGINWNNNSESNDNRTNSENFDFNLSRINEKLNIHGLPSPVILTPNPSNCIIVDCLLKLFEQKEVKKRNLNFREIQK